MQKLYQVTYSGLWLRGIAFVFAENEQEALELVGQHHLSVNFEDVEAAEIPAEGVIYNDNGAY